MTSPDMPARLRHGLIVSCQAPLESPLHDPYVIARMALAAERQGACAVRIDTPAHVAAVRQLVAGPIIGLYKQTHAGSSVYITPTRRAAIEVIEAGADIVAVDATARRRPGDEHLADVIATVKAHGRLVMADVATTAQGLAAIDLGADLVATTLAGYTQDGAATPGPDLALIAALAAATSTPIVAEGRVRTPADVRDAWAAGAHAVVVGGAITGIDALVRAFVAAMPARRRDGEDA